jgi:hypothetical protein
MRFVDKHHKVMTQYLTKYLMDHRHVSLAPQAVAELPLHHGECGFNVGQLVVGLQKLFALGISGNLGDRRDVS